MESAAIEAWLGRLTRRGTLLLAVSGGGDSMAMLCLFEEALRRRDGSGLTLHVATVDHGLRPESADEARTVASFCAGRGLSHEILTWRGERPRTGLQKAAREARYGLLREAARRAGAFAVLTAHTLDDQRETVAMRAARAETGHGLAGMAEAVLYARDCWILRPLLGVRRAALRDCLLRRGIEWFDDPGNNDPRFERARLRGAGGAGLNDDRRVAAAGRQRRAAAGEAAAFVARAARMVSPSLALIECPPEASRNAAALAALCEIAGALGGSAFPPAAAQKDALAGFLADPGRRRHTLLRCVFEKRQTEAGGQAVALWREARDLPVLTVPPGGEAVWDRRWLVRNEDRGRPLHVGPQGPGEDVGPHGEGESTGPHCHPQVPPRLLRAAAASAPALRFEGEAQTAPAPPAGDRGRGFAIERVIARHDTFLPVFDLMLANALARLLGRAPYPVPPLGLDPSS